MIFPMVPKPRISAGNDPSGRGPKDVSSRLAREALVAKVNGRLVDLALLRGTRRVADHHADDPEGLDTLRQLPPT